MPTWRSVLDTLPKGARVVVRSPSGQSLADILLACFDHGIVAVPLHARSTGAEVEAIADRVSASAVIDVCRADVEIGLRRGRPDHPDAAGLAFIMFTSGSTGRPKGVMLDREAVLGNARKTAELHRFTPERPHGTSLPLFHCNALVMSLFGTRLTGAPLVLNERFDPHRFFADLDTAGAATASTVPVQLHELLEARPPWPSGLEYLITAAAPLSSDLARRFHDCYGPRLRQGYGLTETVNFSFVTPLLDSTEFVEQYVANTPPVGVPVSGTELRLEDGEVWIRSPERMRGYWEDPQATSDALTSDGWMRTGDHGALRDGLLVLTGRKKEIVNRGGEKYYPLDIERQWREAGLTGTFAAVAVEEPLFGQEVGLVTQDFSIEGVRTLCESASIRPVVVQSAELLTTSTGKPQRAEMSRRLATKRDDAQRYEELLVYAVRTAEKILAGPHKPTTAQSAHMYNQMIALTSLASADGVPGVTARTAVHETFDALVDYWPLLASGAGTGGEMMHRQPGLWKRLMHEWPLVSYAELAADVLTAGGLLSGRVFEAGSGVGNTTSRIAHLVDGEFIWSDCVPELVARGTWSGRGVVYNLDEDPSDELRGFDTVLATNAVHCAADKAATLSRLHSMLKEGGRLVLSEGNSPTTPEGTPWALDYLCSLWGGWWDRGGFRSRWEWLGMLQEAGFKELGFSAMRAGRHDLGGVVWGVK